MPSPVLGAHPLQKPLGFGSLGNSYCLTSSSPRTTPSDKFLLSSLLKSKGQLAIEKHPSKQACEETAAFLSPFFPPVLPYGRGLNHNPTKLQWVKNYLDIKNFLLRKPNSPYKRLITLRDNNQQVIAAVTLDSYYPPDTKNTKVAELAYLAVASEHQKKGLGQALVQIVEQEAKAGGARSVLISVDQDKPELRRFYQRLGYKKLPLWKALWRYEPWYWSRITTLGRLWDSPYYEKKLS